MRMSRKYAISMANDCVKDWRGELRKALYGDRGGCASIGQNVDRAWRELGNWRRIVNDLVAGKSFAAIGLACDERV